MTFKVQSFQHDIEKKVLQIQLAKKSNDQLSFVNLTLPIEEIGSETQDQFRRRATEEAKKMLQDALSAL